MPSSISSSEARELAHAPAAEWRRVLWTALLVVAAIAAAIEVGLRLRGYSPTVQDSPQLWSRFRSAASSAPADSLILVGSSRIQLDVDLDVLQRETGRLPLQLA